MAVPKRKKSRARRDMRRAHYMKIDVPSLAVCPQCHEPKLPHRACIHCGYYKGREVVRMEEGK